MKATRAVKTLFGPAAAGLALTLGACGGGSTTPTPMATPSPVVTSVVIEGGSGLAANTISRSVITTPVSGRLDVTINWSLDSDDLDVFVARGNCNFDRFFAGQCEVLGSGESRAAKPETASVAAAAAGPYTLFVGNHGPGDEGYSWKVVITPDGQ